MPLTPPITNLPIDTERSGFYAGFNRFVAFGSKVLIGLLILWAAVFPEQAGTALSRLNSWLLGHFGHWYMYVVFSTSLSVSRWHCGRNRDGSSLADLTRHLNFPDFPGFR